MSKSPSRVTAAEIQTGDGGPLNALINFHRRLDACKLRRLTASSRGDDLPSMGNPIGGKRRGRPAVRKGSAKLFEVLAIVQVAFHDFTSQGNHDRYLFVGHEKSVCRTPTTSLDLRVRTTRRFIRIKGASRQIRRRLSTAEPALRAEYQLGIFGATLKRPA